MISYIRNNTGQEKLIGTLHRLAISQVFISPGCDSAVRSNKQTTVLPIRLILVSKSTRAQCMNDTKHQIYK